MGIAIVPVHAWVLSYQSICKRTAKMLESYQSAFFFKGKHDKAVKALLKLFDERTAHNYVGLAYILNCITNLNENKYDRHLDDIYKSITSILMREEYYSNSLTKAIKDNPNDIPALIEVYKTLPLANQSEIFKQSDKNKNDIFMLAAKYNPQILKPLFDWGDDLRKSNISISISYNNKKENFLKLLIEHHGRKSYRSVTSMLSSKNLETLLSYEEENPLYYAMLHKPSMVAEILSTLKSFSPDARASILSKRVGGNKENFLIASICTREVDIVKDIFNILSDLSDEQKFLLLSDCTNLQKKSSLMFAFESSLEIVTIVLKVIKTMNKEYQKQLFDQIFNGKDALQFLGSEESRTFLRQYQFDFLTFEETTSKTEDIMDSSSSSNIIDIAPPSSAGFFASNDPVDSNDRNEEYDLCCPITHEIMTDPVKASDGFTYERAAITSWIKRAETSPITRQPLLLKDLSPDNDAKAKIDDYNQRQSMNNI